MFQDDKNPRKQYLNNVKIKKYSKRIGARGILKVWEAARKQAWCISVNTLIFNDPSWETKQYFNNVMLGCFTYSYICVYTYTYSGVLHFREDGKLEAEQRLGLSCLIKLENYDNSRQLGKYILFCARLPDRFLPARPRLKTLSASHIITHVHKQTNTVRVRRRCHRHYCN